MAVITFVGKPRILSIGGKHVYQGCGIFNSTDATGDLVVPKGAIVGGNFASVGTATAEYIGFSAAPTAGVGTGRATLSPTAGATLGADYVTLARNPAASGTKFFFEIEYDSV